jgi:hypothetical protein
VWRAKYGSTWIDFIDDGSFSPQTRIDNFLLFEAGKRKFNWWGAIGDITAIAVHAPGAANHALWNAPTMFSSSASYTDPDNCSIVRTISADGTMWVNPALTSQQPFVFPSPEPTPSTPVPSPTPFRSGDIAISDCEFEVAGEGYLTVRYTNVGQRPASRIVFRLPYKDSAIDFTDSGKFSPSALISHSLRQALPDTYRSVLYTPLAMQPADCAVATVQYDDGSTWQNPALNASPQPLPSPPADALPAQDILHAHWQLHGFPTPIPSSTPAAATGSQ